MTISLSPEMRRFVEEKVKSGQYASADDVMRHALALLKAQDTITPDDVTELRRLLASAIDQADRGELTPHERGEPSLAPTH